MIEHDKPVRTNGIAVVRFQTAVLWTAAISILTGLIEAFTEYKLAATAAHEVLVTRLTVLETQFGTITLQLSDLKAGQKELLRR
jgi:hypothetical protein